VNDARLEAAGLPRSPGLVRTVLPFLALAGIVLLAVALWHTFGPRPNLAPDFTLTDQSGAPFTLSMQRPHPVVLFFGYTHCPDACPTALASMARALRMAGMDDSVRVAFISVDPHRDTPAVLKRYVNLFDPHFVGVTGTRPQLERVEDAYHTWSAEIPADHGPHDDYTVAHGSTIYFIDGGGALRGFASWDDDPAKLASALKQYFS